MSLRCLFLDLNSFFASCEQQARPELRGRPVAVVAMLADTTCCLAASAEAKKLGVKTGTPVRQARQLIPDLRLIVADTARYVEFHERVKSAIDTVVPVRKHWSIDEFECRLLGAQQQRPAAEKLARRIKRAVARDAGECLTCSIGIASNRVLAKLGTDLMKPDGLVVIEQHELPDRLYGLKLQDFAGIGPRIERRLLRFGIASVQDLCARSEQELAQAWGSIVGIAWWRWLRGLEVSEPTTRKGTIGHEHVLEPMLRTGPGARGVLVRLIHKAAARARGEGYLAGEVRVHVQSVDGRWWCGRCRRSTTAARARASWARPSRSASR